MKKLVAAAVVLAGIGIIIYYIATRKMKKADALQSTIPDGGPLNNPATDNQNTGSSATGSTNTSSNVNNNSNNNNSSSNATDNDTNAANVIFTATGNISNYSSSVTIADVLIDGKPCKMTDGSNFRPLSNGMQNAIVSPVKGTHNVFVRFSSYLQPAGSTGGNTLYMAGPIGDMGSYGNNSYPIGSGNNILPSVVYECSPDYQSIKASGAGVTFKNVNVANGFKITITNN